MAKLEKLTGELKAAHPNASTDQLFELLAAEMLRAEQAEAEAAKEKAALEESQADLKELNEKLSDYESGKVKKMKPEVTFDKKSYVIKSPGIKIHGVLYTAQQIKENKEEITHQGKTMKIVPFLLKIGSGILVPKT